jgi:hypothetical protein
MLCLGINEASLEFDGARVIGRIAQRQVPCSTVSPISDRHLHSDTQWRGDELSEGICEPKVAGIPHRLFSREGSQPQVQPDDGG